MKEPAVQKRRCDRGLNMLRTVVVGTVRNGYVLRTRGTSRERTACDPGPGLITNQQRNRGCSGGRRYSTDVTVNPSQQPAAGKLLNMTVGHHQPLATGCYGDPLRIYRSHNLTERRGKKTWLRDLLTLGGKNYKTHNRQIFYQ
jgi:hypothetical protein